MHSVKHAVTSNTIVYFINPSCVRTAYASTKRAVTSVDDRLRNLTYTSYTLERGSRDLPVDRPERMKISQHQKLLHQPYFGRHKTSHDRSEERIGFTTPGWDFMASTSYNLLGASWNMQSLDRTRRYFINPSWGFTGRSRVMSTAVEVTSQRQKILHKR